MLLISLDISLYFVASSACFLKLSNCFSCCLFNSSARFKLASAASNLDSASSLLACIPEMPAASSKTDLLSAGLEVTRAPILPWLIKDGE